MIHRIFFDGSLEVLRGLSKISPDELDNTKGNDDIAVLLLDIVRLNEALLKVVQLEDFTLLEDGQTAEVRMVLQPACQIFHGFLSFQFIGA